jgi:cellulose synthase/poly-beta-1,6-N-acetylglucosamine synthase-like glycosyltransferase
MNVSEPSAASVEQTEKTMTAWPPVSVIMPVLNEERHLAFAVNGVLAQGYPGELELILAIGPSSDRTQQIADELAAADPRVRSVPNPTGRTPAALNAALSDAKHGIVVRVDGHGELAPGYIRTAVRLLEETGAANVGGIMRAEGVSLFEQTVARAMTSKLGVGNARFHTGGDGGPSDTVYLGVFRREVLDELGGYDEHFTRAQDWELNHRIRESGRLIWFDPSLSVTYRPRPTFRALAKQYKEYGRWRRVVMRTHAGTANFRYLAPPGALLAVAAGTVVGLAGVTGGPVIAALGFVIPAGYLGALTAGALYESRGLPAGVRARLPLVLATMHGSWAYGFLTSPARLAKATGKTAKK